MKMYHGWRDANGTAHVNVEAPSLIDLRLDLVTNHSADRIRVGVWRQRAGAVGPLALLADAVGSDRVACCGCTRPFKWRFVAASPVTGNGGYRACASCT